MQDVMISSLSSIDYPPGPHSILPNILLRRFLHDPIKTLMDITRRYGDISHFKFGRQQHIYLLNNPRYIEEVLVKKPQKFYEKKTRQTTKRLLGEGLVTSEGEFHDRQRRIIQPTFHPNRVKTYGEIVITSAARMC
jgi:cytochrome P450